jgi:hypothetical protein
MEEKKGHEFIQSIKKIRPERIPSSPLLRFMSDDNDHALLSRHSAEHLI